MSSGKSFGANVVAQYAAARGKEIVISNARNEGETMRQRIVKSRPLTRNENGIDPITSM